MSKISKRVVRPSLIGAAAVGAVAVGGFAIGGNASATAPSEPALENASARFVAPSDGAEGAFTFTADVSDDSGVKSLKVLAWPDDKGLEPTAEEMAHVDRADCKSVDDEKARCTYTLRVSERQAEKMERGEWTVSALATARDGDTTFVPEADTVTLDF